jgi:hypothetical protein
MIKIKVKMSFEEFFLVILSAVEGQGEPARQWFWRGTNFQDSMVLILLSDFPKLTLELFKLPLLNSEPLN